MRRATEIIVAGNWRESTAIASITLPFDDRHRRRYRYCDDDGEACLLDLPVATVIEDGDGLRLEDGGIIIVHAADEPVADIHGMDPAHTARLAWHIGNRHTPLQVLTDGDLRIHDDHVLVAMAEGLGAQVTRRMAPFTPEPGAYAGAGGAGSSGDRGSGGHGHSHDH